MTQPGQAPRLARLQLNQNRFETASGRPVYLIGANFWPKRSGPMMYRDPWDAAAVGADLDELAALGANAVRCFCFWPDFMPTPDAVSEDALERLASVVALAAQRGMWSLPTFFVGHMSGENWDPPWHGARDWYVDPSLLERQEFFARTVAARFRGDPNIAAWIVTNEWPLYAGATSAKLGTAWAQRICAAVREADPQRALSLGDGAWDVVWGQENGLPALALRDHIDFFGPHFYPKETDALRHSLVGAFSMRMLAPLGKPILLEEFGCSSDQADDEFAADYYRTALWSSFGAGNCGALAWNSHDFPLPYRRPYAHHPYELHFGLIRSDGSRKPQASEFARFARFASSFQPGEWQPVAPQAAIARTSYFLQALPFDWGWSKAELRDLYLAAYALCVKGKLEAGFVDLGPLPDAVDAPPSDRGHTLAGLRLLIVPCLQQVTMQDAARLEAFVRAGGTAYVSHGGEPWHGALAAFIGARPRIRYGLVEAKGEEREALAFVARFGGIDAGDTLRFELRGDWRRGAPLPLAPTSAEVLALDSRGAPALLRNRIGRGAVVFCAYPLEYYLVQGIQPNESDETWRLYAALAALSDCRPPVYANHPLVQTFSFGRRGDPAELLVLLVNHAWEPVEFFVTPVELRGHDLESGAPVSGAEPWRLPAKGVVAARVNCGP